MPWHHIIPRHEWKKRFGSLKGFNAIDNKVNLSHENHKQIHQRYADEGSMADNVAAKAMSGKLLPDEIQREISKLGGLNGGRPPGFTHTKEFRQDLSNRMKGNKYRLGSKPSIETKQKITIKLLGNKHLLGHKHTKEAKLKMSITLQSLPRLTCPYCGVVGGPANMKRYHFGNCKKVGL